MAGRLGSGIVEKNPAAEKPTRPKATGAFYPAGAAIVCRAVPAILFVDRAADFKSHGLCRLAAGRSTGHAAFAPGCR